LTEFLELQPPDQALSILLESLLPQPQAEVIASAQALGRVNLREIVAPHPLPAFPRSTVDGYALRAADTHGSSESLPAYLTVVGEIPMGVDAAMQVNQGECALIHTGGMLPPGADAVVMIEHTQSTRPGEVEIMRPAAAGENLLTVGEDVLPGQVVIPAGVRLRPAEIGGLMALGITQVVVARQPRVGILSSGDELVPPDAKPGPAQVRDVNAYTLSALVEELGGLPVRYGILPDQASLLEQAASQALQECDVVVITAGSSASGRDLTAQVVNQLGQPGVLVHGVNVRPGKPTILAVCDGKAVIGLPGNPVSALVIASLFISPLVEALLGVQQPRPRARLQARLTLNLPSQAGREDWVPVKLLAGERGHQAEPVFGKSNLIFTLSRADGLVRIAPDATGLAAGEVVEVYLF
jgi:molybdopterin molybdotransferase